MLRSFQREAFSPCAFFATDKANIDILADSRSQSEDEDPLQLLKETETSQQ
jgi:hypothetical protein